ncbi:hypothetical protein J6590_077712 [Homalodisca vitripennis]|nr:hypothetical protein J6590_077712 [Homalodisca vitripennis]
MEIFIFNSLAEILIVLFLLLLWALYWFITKDYYFWEKMGVPCKKAIFPFGSLKDVTLGKEHLGKSYSKVYTEFSGEPYFGVVEFNGPALVIRDPELVKHILIKDFNHFVDRVPFVHNPKESISQHLFLMYEEDGWRDMRHKLSPAFSSVKIKHMFQLMLKNSKQLEDYFNKITEKQVSVDLKRAFGNFAIDVIASCAFGVETNSLSSNSSEFYQTAEAIFRPSMGIILRYIMMTVFPSLSLLLNLELFPQEPKKMLHDLVTNTVKYREKYNVCRNDFLDILISIKNNRNTLDETEEEGGSTVPCPGCREENLSSLTPSVNWLVRDASVKTAYLESLVRFPSTALMVR